MEWLDTLLQSVGKPFKWWVVIAPWEQGLRVRLGKKSRKLLPGIHFVIPFFDRVYRIGTRLRLVSEGGQTLTSLDGKIVTLSLAVQYAIVDIQKLFNTVTRPESTLLSRTQVVVSDLISKTNANEISCQSINEHLEGALPGEEWGLGQVRGFVTTFAFVRTYRFLLYQDRQESGVDYDLEKSEGE